MTQDVVLADPNRDQLAKENELLRTELAKLKKGASNHGFVQVSRKYLDELDELAFRSPTARKLLTILVKAMNRQNAVMVSQASLVRMTGFSSASVKRAIALLREQQWLEILKVGTANVYRINSSVFWTARADGRWTSFAAEVVVNFDEQDAITKAAPLNPPKSTLRHIPVLSADEDVVVTGTNLGAEDPPEQSQLDFHRNL